MQSLNQPHLGNNELCILWAIQLQLLGNVGQGDSGIGETDHAHTWERKEWWGGQGGQTFHDYRHPEGCPCPLQKPSPDPALPAAPETLSHTCLNDVVPQSDD